MKKVTRFLSRGLATLVLAGAGVVLAPSHARADAIDFTVDEGVVGDGTLANTFTANDINGKYEENLVLVPDTVSTGDFTAYLIVNFGAYVDLGPGPDPTDQLGANLDGTADSGAFNNLYGLYALVTVTGTYSSGDYTGTDFGCDVSLDCTQFSFDLSGSTASIWVDPQRDTIQDYTTATVDATTSSEDLAVLSANMINISESGGSVILRNYNPLDPTSATVLGGRYAITYLDPTLETFGKIYWPSLASFTLTTAIASGDIDTTGQGSVFPGDVRGDTDLTLDGVSAVPEPASLVLLGTGLLTAGAARRRSKNKK